MWSMGTIILLTTFIQPSVWGWKAVDLVSLVSNSVRRLDQNVLTNLLYQYDIMVNRIPKCTHTHSKKILVMLFTMILFLQATNIAILENLSTTINTQSLPCLIEGRPDIQSMEMDSHCWLGIGRGVYRLCFLMVGLVMVQTMQNLIYLPTSSQSLGQ